MEKIKALFRNKTIRNQIIFTCLMLIVFRIGSNIPVPGIDREYLSQVFANDNMGILEIFNLFSGGSFANFTVFALGVTPYITASIIVQLLGVAFPYFENLQKEGKTGREKLGRITRISAFFIALLQAVGYAFGFFNQAIISRSPLDVVIITMLLVSGSMFLMWIGERIDEFGIGSGLSILIYGSIVASLPGQVNSIITRVQGGSISVIEVGLIILGVILITAATVYVEEGQRKIPVQYGAKVKNGRKIYSRSKTFIPVKVNQSGVLPVIFASSMLQFPVIVLMLIRDTKVHSLYTKWLSPDGMPGVYVYSFMLAVLIFLFSYFYQEIAFNTEKTAEDLNKAGGCILGIRPGYATKKYLRGVSMKLTFAGAVFLSLIAVIPIIFSKFTGISLVFGGTSLLIIVGVTLEIERRLTSKNLISEHKGFLG